MSNARFRGGRQRPVFEPTVAAPAIAQPAMPAGKWIVHWRRIGLVLCGLLFLAVAAGAPLFLNACMQTREATIQDPKTGEPYYVGEGGKATKERIDPKTGLERARATVPESTGQTENMIDGARSLTGMLPGPFGFIADALLGVGALAGGVAYKIQRRKRLEELGLSEEVIETADDVEEARKKLTNHPDPKVQKRVAEVRTRRNKPKPA
ncbi:hypothetical protein BURC_04143 [Burkholderiaceae bacterium]|nr:hypothetical protein BURC_04143 [Burkholderiaceae bacterium]